MSKRCEPEEMRKNMEVAYALQEQGVDFVAIPVTSPEHKTELIAELLRILERLENASS